MNIPLQSAVRFTLDGRTVSVPAGTTVWEAARQHGIDIPVLCHSPRLRPVGVCRMCVVDVGGRGLAASCVRACEEGMTVRTGGDRVEKQRRMLTALLLAEHPTPCEKEKTTADCELEALARQYGLWKDSLDCGEESPLSISFLRAPASLAGAGDAQET